MSGRTNLEFIAQVLREFGIDPQFQGDMDITFFAHSTENKILKGAAEAVERYASITLARPYLETDESMIAAAQNRLDEINKDSIMEKEGVKWMIFQFDKKHRHIVFYAHLHALEEFVEEECRRRITCLITHMNMHLPDLEP